MALDPRSGLNSYWLIQLLENVSQLQIGYDNDVDDINQDLVLQFLKEGFQTIVDTDTRWPWFETNYITTKFSSFVYRRYVTCNGRSRSTFTSS
jgi:hypothetical protein